MGKSPPRPHFLPSASESEEPAAAGLRVLFADDEENLRELMRMELPSMGHQVVVCANGHEAMETLASGVFDVAILDIQMPGLTGIEVLQKAKGELPETEFIILTGHATVDTAVEALRHGAFDYLTKPCRWAELEMRLSKIAEKRRLKHQAMALETRLRAAEGESRLVGDSSAMEMVHRLVQTVGPTECSVLILGETGTGKELVARELHDCSRRSKMPFVPVNCGALPENLVESELFGHRKGAFTGADQHRKGLFEIADGGTLFLDEVGELDKSLQVKLLRFLELGEIRRVGENEPFQVNVRIVCATNRDLKEMVAEDTFRQDLYFRINTFEVHLPPLQNRLDDIPALVNHLLMRRKSTATAKLPLVTAEAIATLRAYHWPGNVRELANVVEHAEILSGGGPITPDHLPQQIRTTPYAAPRNHSAVPDHAPTLRELEMKHILAVLEKHQGNKTSTAKELGISLKTLYNKMNQLQSA